MNTTYYIGAVLVIALITVVGIYSGRHVKSESDFSTGGKKAGVGIVVGSIIGTLVGGASTIGTAQLAFSYGFSAWWFSLGGGIACLLLAVFFTKPLYNSGINTLPQVFSKEYGPAAATTATIMTSLGSFLSIVSQILSGVALITSVSSLGSTVAIIVIIVLMIAYVVFGGVWGAGMVGMAKTVLLYASIGICGILAIKYGGGFQEFYRALPAGKYFNLIARGVSVDIGAGLSLIVGVLTTQSYVQAIISARSLKISRTGVLISAAIIPLIGLAGVYVGMYMKMNYPDINPASALPLFVMEKLPPLVSGAVLATLLVTLVGSGAGVSLAISSMFCNDIYKVYVNKTAGSKKMLTISRLVIVVVLIIAALFCFGNMGTLILQWSFLAMGFRGATTICALCASLFLPGYIDKKYAIFSMIAGAAFVLIGKFTLPPNIDPLFLGIGCSALIIIIGLFDGRRRRAEIIRSVSMRQK
jgi:SSS family solute:Na+ symporter